MSTLSDSFRSLLQEYIDAKQHTRVLVEGLPDSIIEAIAINWNSDKKLFLVTSNKIEDLSDKFEICNADDLTANRINSWCALVGGDESRRIVESIRSKGARTVEEIWPSGFPWRPFDITRMRWKDVIAHWLTSRGINTQKGFQAIELFKNKIANEFNAIHLLCETLENVPIETDYEKLCFQLGLPFHKMEDNVRDVFKAPADLLKRFENRPVSDVIDELEETARSHWGSGQQEVINAIQFLGNRFLDLKPGLRDIAPLAWRFLFQEGGYDHWQTLNSQCISQLLMDHKGKSHISQILVTTGKEDQSVSIIDVEENTRLLFRDPSKQHHHVEVEIVLDQAERKKVTHDLAKIYYLLNNVPHEVENHEQVDGTFTFRIALDKPGKKWSIRVFIGKNSDERNTLSKLVTLWECCEDYPVILVNANFKASPKKRKKAKGSSNYQLAQDLKVPDQGSSDIQIFVHNQECPIKRTKHLGEAVRKEETELVLRTIPSSNAREGMLTLDFPHSGEIEFEYGTGDNYCEVIINVQLEQVKTLNSSIIENLVQDHSRGKSSLRRILEKVDSHEKVGIDEIRVQPPANFLSRIERQQQDKEIGWYPILLDGQTSPTNQGGALKSNAIRHNSRVYVSPSLKLKDDAHLWQNIIAEKDKISEIPAELNAYVEARSRIISALEEQVKPRNTLPLLSRQSFIGLIDPSIIESYLEAYIHLSKHEQELGEHAWLIHAVDSTLIFLRDGDSPVMRLLGPFHPVTLVHLFYVQEILGRRVLNDNFSSLAHVLASSRPIASGKILNDQLQEAKAFAFDSGDIHCLWLAVKSITTKPAGGILVDSDLIEWLRQAGLDPQVGPLGIDDEILPETLRQYIYAYPARQSVSLMLEDCSYRSFQVLTGAMAIDEKNENDFSRLYYKLPGGIQVYDPILKINHDEKNAQLTHDNKLPISWYHAYPDRDLPLDIATVKPSGSVSFREEEGCGSYSSSVPTVRRHLLHVDNGLKTTIGIDINPSQDKLSKLTSYVLQLVQPAGNQLVWGVDFLTKNSRIANWELCSASEVDPRLFIDHVIRNPGTALWTYRLYKLSGKSNHELGKGHFLLTRVSQAVRTSLRKVLDSAGLSIEVNELLSELASSGLTLGDEFLRSGSRAKGAIGQYLVYLATWHGKKNAPLPHWEEDKEGNVVSAGFLLQVDPFDDSFKHAVRNASPDTDIQNDLADMIAFQVRLCEEGLIIHTLVIESKYRSGTEFSGFNKSNDQAIATSKLLKNFLEFCSAQDKGSKENRLAQPERMLLTELVHLGLRLSRGAFAEETDRNDEQWYNFERTVLNHVLSGNFLHSAQQPITLLHYAGETKNNLDNPFARHAKVNFNDAEAYRKRDNPSGAYLDIRKTLEGLLRQTCISPVAVDDAPTSKQEVIRTKTGEKAGSKSSEEELRTYPVEEEKELLRNVAQDVEHLEDESNNVDIDDKPVVEPRLLNPDVILGVNTGSEQLGILGQSSEGEVAIDLNNPATISLFGVQGGGKSYTLGTIVEMATMSIPGINVLPQPLASVIFHYSKAKDYAPEFTSMVNPNSESAQVEMLLKELAARPQGLKDVVLLTPESKLLERTEQYPGINVRPLLFKSSELHAEHWRFLMGAVGNKSDYIKQLNLVMQYVRENLSISTISEALRDSSLPPHLQKLAQTRLHFASLYVKDNVDAIGQIVRPGRLVIVDIRDEYIDSEMALGLFLVLLDLFSQVNYEGNRFNKLIVFDEAHKYMEDAGLVKSLVEVVREMRHKGTSVMVASQDPPSVPISLIELSSQIILHKFNSPSWLKHLKKATQALKDLTPEELAGLNAGEAFVWSSKASSRIFAHQAIKVKCRPRVTQHGGASKTALG